MRWETPDEVTTSPEVWLPHRMGPISGHTWHQDRSGPWKRFLGIGLGSPGPPDGDTCLPQRRGACGQRHLCQVFPDLAQTPVFKIGFRKGNDLPKVRESGPGAAAEPPGGCSPLLPGPSLQRSQPQKPVSGHLALASPLDHGGDDNVLLTPSPTGRAPPLPQAARLTGAWRHPRHQ